jgi:CDP-diacylglycerol--glycerol-3-phosphate 3-phosphatidyltransferase
MARNTNNSMGSLRQPAKKSLTDRVRQSAAILLAPLARLLQRLNISPNAITIIGMGFSIPASIALASGRWTAAILLILVSGLFDGIDGLLARQSNRVTRFGAFLDSVLDRWSDSALFIGLLIFYTRANMQMPAILSGVSLASCLLVSYTRARAEGIGAQCKSGLFTRLERFVALLGGLILNVMPIALWIIAALSTFTAIQRIYNTYRYVQAHREEG